MREVRVWRRQHGPTIVAEVAPVSGMGTWDVCAWREPGRTDLVPGGRHFSFLTDAHAAADMLAAITFGHRCDEHCQPWAAVERRTQTR